MRLIEACYISTPYNPKDIPLHIKVIFIHDIITITPREQGGEMVDNTNPAELVKEIAVVLEEITALESEINAILNEMENNGKELERHNDEK